MTKQLPPAHIQEKALIELHGLIKNYSETLGAAPLIDHLGEIMTWYASSDHFSEFNRLHRNNTLFTINKTQLFIVELMAQWERVKDISPQTEAAINKEEQKKREFESKWEEEKRLRKLKKLKGVSVI